MSRPEAPGPHQLTHLRADDRAGLRVVSLTVLSTMGAVWLSLDHRLVVWLAGQLWLALAFVQWFVLLHECGHDTLFATRRWHAPAGHLAAFFSGIPHHAWRRVHGRHHKWTGWQDLDPTTATLAPKDRGRLERALVNICWRASVPVFAVAYRVGNFWNLPRLFRMFPGTADRSAIVRDTALLAAAYVALVVWVGPLPVLRTVGPALVVSLVVQELLILSQHTHVPQGLSGGAAVRPYPSIEQEPFTRSLRLAPWASTFVLHFDAHELHHMYPFVPGYHLRRIPYQPAHEIGWWRWVASAKRLRGDVLLFQNRDHSGWEI